MILFADLHVAPGGPVTDMGYSERELETLETLNWIADEILIRRPKLVVCLGDTGHNNALVQMTSLNVMCRGFSRIKNVCDTVGAKFFIISGNHDQRDENGKISILSVLKPYGIIVEDKAYFEEMNIGFISYQSTLERFQLAYEWMTRNKSLRYLFTHQDVQGALSNIHHVSESGVVASNLVGAQRIYNGHYHHPHNVGHIHMIGSPMYHNFSDHIQDELRGIVWVDYDNDREERIPNPFTSLYHTIEIDPGNPHISSAEIAQLPAERTHLRVKGTVLQLDVLRSLDLPFKSLRFIPTVQSPELKVTQGEQEFHPFEALQAFVESIDTPLDRTELKKTGEGYLASS